MRRTIAIAFLACSLAGCKDSLGIGGSAALYDIRAHTHSAYTDTDHPPPQPTWTEDHDYDGRLLLTRTGNELRVVLTLRECLEATGCSTRTFRSRDHAMQSEGGPRYEGGTTFYTTVSADDDRMAQLLRHQRRHSSRGIHRTPRGGRRPPCSPGHVRRHASLTGSPWTERRDPSSRSLQRHPAPRTAARRGGTRGGLGSCSRAREGVVSRRQHRHTTDDAPRRPAPGFLPRALQQKETG